MPTVLVNADDLCLHPDIDRGIFQCIEAGVVQSASFCVNGASLDWNKLRELQSAGILIGLHLTLVGEPWGTDGRSIRSWKQLCMQMLTGGKTMRAAVQREAQWQMNEALQHGITPAHIDSHQHVHAFPGVREIVLELAREHRIPRVRVPWCPSWNLIKKAPAGIALQTLASRLRRQLPNALPILGIANAGHNTIEIYQREFAIAPKVNVELCVHPGVNTPELSGKFDDWNFDWDSEREALLDARFHGIISSAGLKLFSP